MSAREIGLLASLLIALALIVSGVSLWSLPVALVVAGVGVGGVGFLLFGEVGE